MSKSDDELIRETAKKREQYNNFKTTGKYRFGQIGIDKETDHVIFYLKDESEQEIYSIPISDLQTHDRQIVWIYLLLEKSFFNTKVLEEFFVALGVLKLLPKINS